MAIGKPENVGIKALEIYFPSQYVDQAELEKHDGVSAGKYTIGLGQTKMAIVDDREDIYSFTLTVVSSLLKKYKIDPNSIGRLEVGTETLLDKSKSVKTVLMQLFGDNTDIEGVDTVNACYGGTSALFNAINWIESSSWDGRNAIVVAADIALYAKGAARPTGGAGAVAMLIGPDAPIIVDPIHGSHMEHAYDFYKPDFTSEYPYVDGRYSLTCYTRALDKCYQVYNDKAKANVRGLLPDILTHTTSNTKSMTNGSVNSSEQPTEPAWGIDRFNYAVFHSPTCKLVAKCYARILYNDFLADSAGKKEFASVPDEIKSLSYEQSLTSKDVEKTFMTLTKERAATRLAPASYGPTNTGNMYTASTYSSLVSLLCKADEDKLTGSRIAVFSYGSGLASSFFSLHITGSISEIRKNLDFVHRLESRAKLSPEDYEKTIELREKAHLSKDFSPSGSIDSLLPGTYYLTHVDDKYRRSYSVKN